MSSPPFFDHGSAAVRFSVQIDDRWVIASIGKEVLHYFYCPDGRGEDPMSTYQSHRSDIETAVRQRVAKGAREPVMVREADLPARPVCS